MDLGDRIRRLRVHRGLSQTQLAGRDMSRAFISQVENGRCTPSQQTLSIIAQRLGKPVSYFYEDEPDSFGAKFLLDAAAADMEKGLCAEALPKLEEAIRMLRRGDDSESELRATLLMAHCLFQSGRTEEALDAYDLIAEGYQVQGKPSSAFIPLWLEMAHCYLVMEQFSTAERYYLKVIRGATGKKSYVDVYAAALCYLGATLSRLGQYEQAISRYQEALLAISPEQAPVLWGKCAFGVGGCYRRAGKPKLALMWNRRALDCLRTAKHPEAVRAEHNVALALMDLGNWEEAYALLSRIWTTLKDRDDQETQANVMDDLATYWIHKGDYDRAEQICWQALDLVSGLDTTRLRGLLYRKLGEIYMLRGNRSRALELLQVSYALLQRTRSVDEIMATLSTMHSLSQ